MAYQNNNNEQKFEVSTRGISFLAHQENESNALIRLSTQFYGDLFKIVIAPPTITADGKMTFPRDNNIPINLKPEKAYALYSLIRTDICQAIDENRAIIRALYLDKKNTNAIVIKVIPVDGGGLPRVIMSYLTNYTNGRPETGFVVEFPKSEYYATCDDYGALDDLHDCHTYFMMFTYALHAYCMAHGGGFAHSNRVSNQYINDKITGYLVGIAGRLGISTGGPGNSYGGNATSATKGSASWTPPTVPVGAAPAPPTESSSFDDLPF